MGFKILFASHDVSSQHNPGLASSGRDEGTSCPDAATPITARPSDLTLAFLRGLLAGTEPWAARWRHGSTVFSLSLPRSLSSQVGGGEGGGAEKPILFCKTFYKDF